MAYLHSIQFIEVVCLLFFVAVTVSGVNGGKQKTNQYSKVAWIARDGEMVCGGYLVDELWVITSASCIQQGELGQYLVHLEYFNHRGRKGNGQEVKPECFVIHPNYTGEANSTDDIAMVKLEQSPNVTVSDFSLETAQAAKGGKHKRPICFVPDRTTDRRSNEILRGVRVLIFPDWKCNKIPSFDKEKQICYQGPRGPCPDDKGVPVICKVRRSLLHVGIHTHGEVCRRGLVEVGVRLSYYTSWINEAKSNGCVNNRTTTPTTSTSTTPTSTTMTTTTTTMTTTTTPTTTPDPCSVCSDNATCSNLGDSVECNCKFGLYTKDNGQTCTEWDLVFRGVKDIGVSIYDTYNNSGYPLVSNVYNASQHYRSTVLDIWASTFIEKIKIVWFLNGQDVANIIFTKGSSSTNYDWFSAENILESSWTDGGLNASTLTLLQDKVPEASFTIVSSGSECPGDPLEGYGAVLDGVTCGVDFGTYPQIVYSPINGPVKLFNSTNPSADVTPVDYFEISVKYSGCC